MLLLKAFLKKTQGTKFTIATGQSTKTVTNHLRLTLKKLTDAATSRVETALLAE